MKQITPGFYEVAIGEQITVDVVPLGVELPLVTASLDGQIIESKNRLRPSYSFETTAERETAHFSFAERLL